MTATLRSSDGTTAENIFIWWPPDSMCWPQDNYLVPQHTMWWAPDKNIFCSGTSGAPYNITQKLARLFMAHRV